MAPSTDQNFSQAFDSKANPSDQTIFPVLKPPIWSKAAVRSFSILFSTVFGGVMLRQNLRAIERRKEGNVVLIIGIAYTVLVFTILAMVDIKSNAVNLLPNIAGAAVMTEVVFNRFFKDEKQFPKKKIWAPLLIGIAIVVLFIALFVWAGSVASASQ